MHIERNINTMLTREQKMQGKFHYEDTSRRLMEEKGVVSLWIGNTDMEASLLDYIEEDYTELEPDFTGFDEYENSSDFNFVINLFGLDFGFGFYDHDFLMCEFFEPTNSLRKIASLLDYLPSIQQRFVDLVGKTLDKEYNTVIFFIDYRYIPDETYIPPYDPNRKVEMKYIGAVNYDEK